VSITCVSKNIGKSANFGFRLKHMKPTPNLTGVTNIWFDLKTAQQLRSYRLLPVYFREICIVLASELCFISISQEPRWLKIFLFFFTGSKLQVSKFAWQTLWEALSFEENGQWLCSQQGPLFGNSLAAPLLTSLNGPSWFKVLLSVAILFEITVIQINCSFCLQGNSFDLHY
jgi:hypothetical protein